LPIRLSRLDERTAVLAAFLVSPSRRNADLALLVRRWGEHDIVVEPSHLARLLDLLRTKAIPTARVALRTLWSPDLREEASDELERWEGLEAALADALAWADESSDELPLHPAEGAMEPADR